MICPRGLTFAMVFLLGCVSPSGAQTVADPFEFGATNYSDYPYQIEPYGGFGLETIQSPFVGTAWIDRFGLLHATESAQPAPRVSARRNRPRPTGSVASVRVSQTGYRLPTGSLYWPGASGVVLYSPGLRFQTYGGGYGNGPYGSVDCGMMYKGMWLGY